MESYLWQSALLMLMAYFLGAVLGCLLRRLFTSSAPAEVAALGRSPADATGAATAAATTMREAPEPVQPRIETVAQPAPPQEAKIAESARFERVLSSSVGTSEAQPIPKDSTATEHTATDEPSTTDNAAASAAAAAAAAAVATRTAKPASKPPESRFPQTGSSGGPSAVVAPIATTPADDLRRIGDIDDKTATLLNGLGYTRFSDISGWTANDATKVRGALGDRAARESWIEQAKILADEKDTGRLRRLAGEGWTNPWLQLAPSGDLSDELPNAPLSETRTDNLLRIDGIDSTMQEQLYSSGIRTYAQIATWTASDVQRVNALLGRSRYVSRQDWIEQAKLLAEGHDTENPTKLTTTPTAFASSLASQTGTADAAAAPAATTTIPPAASATVAAATASVAVATPQAPAVDIPPSDLLQIEGIDAATRDQLTSIGVTTYAQISNWTAADIQKFDTLVGETGRVSRQNWIEQAKILAEGKQTVFAQRMSEDPPTTSAPGTLPAPEPLPSVTKTTSDTAPSGASAVEPAPPPAAASRPSRLADAIRQNSATTKGSSVSGMRSVRSQLLSGESVLPSGEVQDLKKIRGIGVLIEKKLNAMGIYNYDQVANWSAGDIERISSSLDFKGRIEREGWVEQARILASGGQTEFSKRLT